jgi:hypothetical protein
MANTKKRSKPTKRKVAKPKRKPKPRKAAKPKVVAKPPRKAARRRKPVRVDWQWVDLAKPAPRKRRLRKPKQKPPVSIDTGPSLMIQWLRADTRRIQDEIRALFRSERIQSAERTAEQRPDPAMIAAAVRNAAATAKMRGSQTVH